MKRVVIAAAVLAGTVWTLAHAHAQQGGAAGYVRDIPNEAARGAAAAPGPIKMRPGVGYYTEAQAGRGKEKFARECTDCHTLDSKKPARVSYGGNLASGFRAIAEKRYNNRPLYPSVYYYWKRMESEPGDNTDRVSQTDKLDILTYLLQQNGFPPGPKELVVDLGAMKGMYLDPGPG